MHVVETLGVSIDLPILRNQTRISVPPATSTVITFASKNPHSQQRYCSRFQCSEQQLSSSLCSRQLSAVFLTTVALKEPPTLLLKNLFPTSHAVKYNIVYCTALYSISERLHNLPTLTFVCFAEPQAAEPQAAVLLRHLHEIILRTAIQSMLPPTMRFQEACSIVLIISHSL